MAGTPCLHRRSGRSSRVQPPCSSGLTPSAHSVATCLSHAFCSALMISCGVAPLPRPEPNSARGPLAAGDTGILVGHDVRREQRAERRIHPEAAGEGPSPRSSLAADAVAGTGQVVAALHGCGARRTERAVGGLCRRCRRYRQRNGQRGATRVLRHAQGLQQAGQSPISVVVAAIRECLHAAPTRLDYPGQGVGISGHSSEAATLVRKSSIARKTRPQRALSRCVACGYSSQSIGNPDSKPTLKRRPQSVCGSTS